ncbi:hypothetical protein [Mycolicibacterium wolinskyi]|uniref:hypothetical protein n=1 Tax=Mycolicibacterium wolinskyi TaxID=59750 RepID=UPI003917A938
MTKTVGLGDEAEDITTGFKGIVVAEVRYLDGGIEYGIRSRKGDSIPSITYISSAYAKKIGDGVRVKPQPRVLGFDASGESHIPKPLPNPTPHRD